VKTDDKAYEEYLQSKFLPGRRQYLEYLVYPRYLQEFPELTEICDLGFGNGEFLTFCRGKGIAALGIDSNPHFVASAVSSGLNVKQDDITRLSTIADGKLSAAISDNVLEHLDRDGLFALFRTLTVKLAPHGVFLVIVPGKRGFSTDPTHKTFIDQSLIEEMTLGSALTLIRSFRWPINVNWVSRIWRLNMSVFVIKKSP